MQAGDFKEAYLFINQNGKTESAKLFKANIQVGSSVVCITHYVNGEKQPQNKRTLILPLEAFNSFDGIGYASKENSK